MTPIDDQLDRLFRAVGARPSELTAPYGMETRVLAAWRDARMGGGFWNPAVLVRGLLAASLLMLLSFLPLARMAPASPTADYLRLADSTVQTSDHP